MLDDVAAAREVWEGVVKGGLGRYAEAWEAYAAMERSLRNLKEARAVYKRAYSRRLEEGGQLAMCYAWLRFEREEGRCGRRPCWMGAVLFEEELLCAWAAAVVCTPAPDRRLLRMGRRR